MGGEKDRGWAWMCVLGSFYVHFVVFGLMQSFGVLYVELIDYFASSRSETAWIGSLLSGLVLLLGPVDVMIIDLVGLRAATVLGAILACVGCSISFLATDLVFLYLSYGVLQGTGMGLIFVSANIIVNQYFEKRRSFANSLASVGGGVGSFVYPPLIQLMMREYSWRGALLITGALNLNCAIFGGVFRPLITTGKHVEKPDQDVTNQEKTSFRDKLCLKLRIHISIFSQVRYSVYVLGAVISAFVYSIPFSHLPDLATDLDIPEDRAAWLVSAIGISSIVGRLAFGRLSDIPGVNRVAFFAAASIICGLTTLMCPLLNTFLLLMLYSVLFGLFIGIWLSLQAVAVADILGVEMIGEGFGNLIFFQGIFLFLGSPMAGWLYDITGDYSVSFYVTGGLLCLGGAVILVYECRRRCSLSPHTYSVSRPDNSKEDHVYVNTIATEL